MVIFLSFVVFAPPGSHNGPNEREFDLKRMNGYWNY